MDGSYEIDSYEIGIVGGGPSAVSLLDALAGDERLPPCGLVVFEPSEHLWRGRPYRPDLDTIRVNAPADDMSLRAGDTGHFEQWLTARDLVIGLGAEDVDRISGTRFVSRAVYGDYLEQTARAALIALHRRGWRIELVRQAVVHARERVDGLVLNTASGDEYLVGAAVLCMGAGRPPDLFGLDGTDGYVPEAYPVRQSLAAIEPESAVCVLGSGLTAVDVVLGLLARGHRGPIRLASRSGVLPAVRQSRIAHRLRHFTPARFRAAAAQGRTVPLEEAVQLMAQELAAAGDSLDRVVTEVEAVRSQEPVSRLRRHLEQVHDPQMGLRVLQQAVPDAGPDLWPLLPETQKEALLATHARTLMSLCCPMPPASAAALLQLIDSGQLELVRDLRAVEAVDGAGFRVHTADGAFSCDHAVNAANARTRGIPQSAEELVGSLTKAGLAQSHPRGGLHVERATSLLTVDGRAQQNLYALGDPAAGSLFFTFGVQSLVDRAADIAATLADRLAVDPARTVGAGVA